MSHVQQYAWQLQVERLHGFGLNGPNRQGESTYHPLARHTAHVLPGRLRWTPPVGGRDPRCVARFLQGHDEERHGEQPMRLG